MAILTNNVREWEELWRAKLPVDEIFELVVDSAWVGMRKPDPAIYQLTISGSGASSPHECLFVDDNEGNIEAARAAGHDRGPLPLQRAGDPGDQGAGAGRRSARLARRVSATRAGSQPPARVTRHVARARRPASRPRAAPVAPRPPPAWSGPPAPVAGQVLLQLHLRALEGTGQLSHQLIGVAERPGSRLVLDLRCDLTHLRRAEAAGTAFQGVRALPEGRRVAGAGDRPQRREAIGSPGEERRDQLGEPIWAELVL